MNTTSGIVKVGGGVVMATALGLVAWRLMAVSTGDLPTAPARVAAVASVAEALPPIDPPTREAPPPPPAASGADPSFVPPVLNEDDPPPPDGGRTADHPAGAGEVKSAVEATDAAYDVVLDLLPNDAKDSAQKVMDDSRATLDKLNFTASNGQIPVGAALAAVEHQRKLVSRKLSLLVTPEQSAAIDKALGVTPADAP